MFRFSSDLFLPLFAYIRSGPQLIARQSFKMSSRTARNPCRQLNSESIKSASLVYLSPLISGKCSIISAKCICDVKSYGIQKAWTEVCSKRDECDKALASKHELNISYTLIDIHRSDLSKRLTEFHPSI